jgi:antitoxin (DNA-binding transcriptional repressor) of toxin-antitoxin stability system
VVKQVNIAEAKAQFSELVEQAEKAGRSLSLETAVRSQSLSR